MGRAYTGTIPPEYQVMATQVTNAGEPKYQPLTRQNYGTIGRSVMGSNDMQDIGGEPEVYSSEMDPLAYASQQTAAMVKKLERETALSQTPNTNINKLIDKTQVQYDDISRDDQVSNVKGMRFTGDPTTVGQAMKYHGDAQFQSNRALDGSDIQASLDRAATGMDKASRASLAQALAHLGPEAIESLPQGAVAGLEDGVQIAGNTAMAGLVMRPTGSLLDKFKRSVGKATGKNVKNNAKVSAYRERARRLKEEETQQESAFDRLTGTVREAAKSSEQRATERAQRAGYQQLAAQESLKRKQQAGYRQLATQETTKKEQQAGYQALAAREAAKSALYGASSAGVPSAFTKLLAERQKEATQNAAKPVAKYHPAQSNFEDSQGRANSTSKLTGAEAKRQMVMAIKKLQAQLREVVGNLTPAQQKQLQSYLKVLQMRWAKLTPKQRQTLINQFQQRLIAFARATQAAKAKAQAKAKASRTGTTTPSSTIQTKIKEEQAKALVAKTASARRTATKNVAILKAAADQVASDSYQPPTMKTDVLPRDTTSTATAETLQRAADAQNGNTAAQTAVDLAKAREFNKNTSLASKRLKAAKLWNSHWNSLTSRLNAKQKAQMRDWFTRTRSTWDLATSVGQKAALAAAKKQMQIITAPTAQQRFDTPPSEVVNDDGTIWGGGDEGGDDYTWEDITADSQGNYDNRVNPWIIGGAVTVTAIVGGMLFMSGKAK